MRREDLDAVEGGPSDDELAEEIRLYEAWQELQRGDLRAIQRRISRAVPAFQPVPVGTGRIRMEDDAA